MKVLKFEGAGCVPRGNVSNCRLRTRIKNKANRIIYLELTGAEDSKYMPRAGKFKNHGFVDHCFYADRAKDKRDNFSLELKYIERLNFEYTLEEILRLVNEKLNCNFDTVLVDDNLNVHNTNQPLC